VSEVSLLLVCLHPSEMWPRAQEP